LKALALFSGGLDSTLAMKVIIDQGIEVIAIHVDTGFGSVGDRVEYMKRMCDHIGAKFEILDLKDKYLDEVLFEPKYGYGNYFNPCIDCHGFMFRHTSKLLEKYDASFMISGEVVGQRPMSQTKDAMLRVQKLSGQEELVVRPLSGKLLPASKPELEGWISRDKLLDFWGRGRSRQFEFAKEIGLENFEHPSGGCLLTDVQFTTRLRDFIANDTLEVDDIDTLKIGRQLRLPDGAKLVVGRKQDENQILENTKSKKYFKGRIVNATGPFVLLSKNASENDIKLAGDFIVTYGKTELGVMYDINLGEIVIQGKRLENKDAMQPYLLK